MKLSVVIPVFNTDFELFDECLTSVFDSSISAIEVIVIDDGSSVDYEKLKKKFPRARFVKTENQGTLAARIKGIELATGDYIAFVDSDDKVSFDYFEAMVARASVTSSDIVLGDWAFLTERTPYVCTNDYTIKKLFMADGDSVLRMYFYPQGTEHSWYVLWNKIFKREVLVSSINEIKKLKLGRQVFAEDVLLTFFAFTVAKKVSNVHLGYYFYRIHDGQQIAVTSKEKFLSQVHQMAKVFDIMERELKIIDRFDEVKYNFLGWKNLMSSSNYVVAKNSNFKDTYEEIKKAYGVDKLKKLPRKAEEVYAKHYCLPKNLDEIDAALKKVCFSNKYLKVYARKRSYEFKELVAMKRILNKKFDIVSKKADATFVCPKSKFSLKNKIIHNHFVYKVGMFFFPKGSKVRKFLKTKL